MAELELKNVEWGSTGKLSQETADKGEAFILALIQDGYSYDAMKAVFIKCVVRTWLRLTKGVVAQTAKKMGTDRNWIFQVLKRLDMRPELEAIRDAELQQNGAAANGAGK